MKLFNKEHDDLIAMFERDKTFLARRLFEKEDKEMWSGNRIYQDDLTNELFLAYRRGYAYGKMENA